MLHKLAIISLGFFLLSGNFNSLSFVNSLPVDLSILSMVFPLIYFLFYTLKKMAIHKSFVLLIFFFALLLPNFNFTQPEKSKMFSFILMFFVLGIVSPTILNSDKANKLFIKSLFITSFSVVIMALLGLDNIHTSGRLTWEGGNSIWLGRATSISVLILLILFLNNKIKVSRFLILFIPSIFITLSTGSKGPLLSIFLSLLVVFRGNIMSMLKQRKNIRRLFILVLFSTFAVYISNMLYPGTFARITNIFASESTYQRTVLYEDALNIISRNPFGVGLGNFQNHSFFRYPHNIILEAFAELGWGPALLLLGILFVSFIGFKNSSKVDIVYKVFLGIFVMALLNSMVSGDLTSPKELYLLMPLGINRFLSYKQTTLKKTRLNRELTSP